MEIIEELAKALHRLSRGGGKALPYENPPADSARAIRTIVRAPIKAYFAASAKAQRRGLEGHSDEPEGIRGTFR